MASRRGNSNSTSAESEDLADRLNVLDLETPPETSAPPPAAAASGPSGSQSQAPAAAPAPPTAVNLTPPSAETAGVRLKRRRSGDKRSQQLSPDRRRALSQQLIDAAKVGDDDLVERLVKEGADLYARDDNGKTALKCAEEGRELDEENAEIYDKVIAVLLRELLYQLVVAAYQGNPDLVETLLLAGAPVVTKDSIEGARGWTALHWAAKGPMIDDGVPEENYVAVIKVLCKHGASLYIRAGTTGGGGTPLHVAVKWDRLGALEELLQWRADTNEDRQLIKKLKKLAKKKLDATPEGDALKERREQIRDLLNQIPETSDSEEQHQCEETPTGPQPPEDS